MILLRKRVSSSYYLQYRRPFSLDIDCSPGMQGGENAKLEIFYAPSERRAPRSNICATASRALTPFRDLLARQISHVRTLFVLFRRQTCETLRLLDVVKDEKWEILIIQRKVLFAQL